MLQLDSEQALKYRDTDSDRRRVYLICVDPSDLTSPVTTEEGGQPTVSVNGASAVNTTNTLVHMHNGIYYVEMTQDEVGELGKLIVYYNSGNVVQAQTVCQVDADPFSEGYPALTVAMGYGYGGS